MKKSKELKLSKLTISELFHYWGNNKIGKDYE